jgi:hypothetical protein
MNALNAYRAYGDSQSKSLPFLDDNADDHLGNTFLSSTYHVLLEVKFSSNLVDCLGLVMCLIWKHPKALLT